MEIALKKFLYPYLVKELTNKVLSEAQFNILQVIYFDNNTEYIVLC